METHIRLKIIRKTPETPDTVTLELAPLAPGFSYLPGQFLTFLFSNIGPRPFRRSYSLSSTPGIDPNPSITVRQTPNGTASQWLTRHARPGLELEALPPAGRFTPPPNGPRDYFMVGGGSGIVPLFSIIKHALSFDNQSIVTLLLANRKEENIIFREALNDWVARFPDRFQLIHFLSEPVGNVFFAPGVRVVSGRLGNSVLEDMVKKCLRFSPADAHFYLCGPKGLMLKSEMTLRFLKIPDEHIHKEIFTVEKPRKPIGKNFPEAHVEIRFASRVFHFRVEPGETILQAATRQGIDLPYSCKTGICTTCSGQCRRGRAVMYGQEGKLDSAAAKGLVLPCVGYPLTPELVIDIPG